MPPTTFAVDLKLVATALSTLLSPPDHETAAGWQSAALDALNSLFQPEKAMFVLALDPTSPPSLVSQSCSPDMLRSYGEHYFRADPTYARLEELGLSRASTMRLLGGDKVAEFHRTEIWNDWFLPNRLLDSVHLGIRELGEPFTAAVVLYYDRSGVPQCDAGGLALMELLWPAFEAGVRTVTALARTRADWIRSLDTLGHAVRILDLDGRLVHQTPRLTRLSMSEPERQRLEIEMGRVGASLRALARGGRCATEAAGAPCIARRVRTAIASYSIRGSLVGNGYGGPWILVAVERAGAPQVSDQSLASHFRLTPREAQVARLLAQGLPNAAIARTLELSPSTALRHTERVLAKLNLHSRAGVAAAIAQAGLDDAG